MASLNLCSLLLLLCLARGSLQGGVKPQASGGRGTLYFPPQARGAGAIRPGAGLGPAGAKAGKYPGYRTQGLPTGLGYGVPNGYGAGRMASLSPSLPPSLSLSQSFSHSPILSKFYSNLNFLMHLPVPGYRGVGYRTTLPLGGLGARSKASKPGYGAGPSAAGYPAVGSQQAYLGGAGVGYPSGALQNGYGNGYGAGGNGFPVAGPQPGRYGNGAQTPYGSQLGGPVGDPAAAKYGGAGQLSYNGQSEAAGLGDYGAGRYGAPQSPYEPQVGGPGGISVDPAAIKYGNGNGMKYMNGGEPQTNGVGAAGSYGALAPGGYGAQLGPGQGLGGYGAKESKYGLNAFLGNGYRGRCPSGKC
ncbi:hypothetical protein lerEdw1_007014 [Lerista edwardsae]|nr:hypothetical protein lerEdw1_007014 [Lerista edwardsae]